MSVEKVWFHCSAVLVMGVGAMAFEGSPLLQEWGLVELVCGENHSG